MKKVHEATGTITSAAAATGPRLASKSILYTAKVFDSDQEEMIEYYFTLSNKNQLPIGTTIKVTIETDHE